MDSKKQIVLLMCLVLPYSLTIAVLDEHCLNFVLPTEMAGDTTETFKQLQNTKHIRLLKIEAKAPNLNVRVLSHLNNSADQNGSNFYNISSQRSVPFDMFFVWANSREEPLLSLITSPAPGSEADQYYALFSLGILSHRIAHKTITFSVQLAKCKTAQNKTEEFDLENWIASGVLRVVAKTKGTVCFPRQGAFHCCEARNGNSKVICNLKPSNRWLSMYFNILINPWMLVVCYCIGSHVLALAISFWLPSIHTSEEGKRLLEPDNVSPVGLRNMISYHLIPNGNSNLDGLKRFFIMIFVLPFPFHFLLALCNIFSILKFWMLSLYFQFGPIMRAYFIAICFLYTTFSLFLSFASSSDSPGRCGVCRRAGVKPRHTVTEEMKHHFYLQTECFNKFYRIFSYLVSPLATKMGQSVLHIGSLTSRLKYMVLLFLLCIWVPILLMILCCLFFIECFVTTDPLIVFANYLRRRESALNGNHIALKVNKFIVLPSFLLAYVTLVVGALPTISFIIIFTVLGIISNLIDFLPYITLALLTFLYLLSNYRCFTNKYLNLKLQLFEACIKQDQLRDDIEQGNMKKTVYFDDQHVPRIPKDIFDLACKEVMPKGPAVCLMLLKQIAMLFFMFLIFLCIMAFAQPLGIGPIVQAFAAIVTGSLPKIASFLSRSTMKKRFEELRLNDRLQDTVKRYALENVGPNQECASNETEEEEIIDLC